MRSLVVIDVTRNTLEEALNGWKLESEITRDIP